jgi:hypothetical protein
MLDGRWMMDVKAYLGIRKSVHALDKNMQKEAK